MKNALLVVSGVAVGLLGALVAMASGRAEWVPPVQAQAGPGGGAGATNGTMILGTGGASPNQNDLCWVLGKVKPAQGPERTVLALYRAERQGDLFNLKDVRLIDADLRLVEMQAAKHEPSFQDVLKALPQVERDAIKPPPPAPANPPRNP